MEKRIIIQLRKYWKVKKLQTLIKKNLKKDKNNKIKKKNRKKKFPKNYRTPFSKNDIEFKWINKETGIEKVKESYLKKEKNRKNLFRIKIWKK